MTSMTPTKELIRDRLIRKHYGFMTLKKRQKKKSAVKHSTGPENINC